MQPGRTKPIFKWPGGKFRLLDFILPELPAGRRLAEPFAGSGAVFLNSAYSAYLVADVNADIIGFYQALADGGEDFVAECRSLFSPGANRADVFYRRRDRFNGLPPGAGRAALFLYCNRHGYNGLIRYNKKGAFNVPFGSFVRPYFPEAEMLACLEKTRRCAVEFRVADFRDTFARLEPGDVVYCDPPYVPLSATANFTRYAGRAFKRSDQADLAVHARKLAERGIPVVISNHDAEDSRLLYESASRTRQASVRRSISCDGGGRGMVEELLAVFC